MMNHCVTNPVDDNFIASFLFPGENLNFAPSSPELANGYQNLNSALTANASRQKIMYKCRLGCDNDFARKTFRDRHEKVCNRELKCPRCDKRFLTTFALKRHLKGVRCSSTCQHCGKILTSEKRLKQHIETHAFKCPKCNTQFTDKQLFHAHCRGHLNDDFLTIQQAKMVRRSIGKSNKSVTATASALNSDNEQPSTSAAGDINSRAQPAPSFRQTEKHILGRSAVVYTFQPEGNERHSILNTFTGRRQQIEYNLLKGRERWVSLRWYITITARMLRLDIEGNVRDEDSPNFRSKAQILLLAGDIPKQVDEAYFKVNSSLENYCSDSSGWVLDKVLKIEQTVLKYVPLGGSCADFNLPVGLDEKQCLISVVGRPKSSSQCFLWSTIAAIEGKPLLRNRETQLHWTQLAEARKKYKLTDSMESASLVSVDMINDFEQINNISVNVFGYDEENQIVFPIRISNRHSNKKPHADLLLLSESNNHSNGNDNSERLCMHYCAITNLGNLVSTQHLTNRNLYVCPRCLSIKYSQQDLDNHLELCCLTEPASIQMPRSGLNFVRFRNFHRQMDVPFVIIARFESFRMPILDHDEPTEGFTVRERKHRVFSFCYFRISVRDSHPSVPVTFVGSDTDEVMNEFLACMKNEQEQIIKILGEIKPMIFCDESLRNIEASNDACHICDQPFLPGDRIVLDHCHVTSVIRGRAHSDCNLSFRLPKFIPVVLENMSAVEGRLILSAKSLYGSEKKITVMAKSIDTYASVTIDKCRYIDFSSFFKAPLGKLIEGLKLEHGVNAFPYTKCHWPSGPTNFNSVLVPLCRDYLHGPENLLDTTLPQIDAFRDRMADEDLDLDEYARAVGVWNHELRDKTMSEYLKFVITTDTLFMSDIITAFRKQVRTDGKLKLDPLQYLTMASFAWDSALRFSDAVLELPTDIEIYLMVENALRGGLAVIGTPRHARANDPRLNYFDPSQQQSSLEFFDFNGLYTSVMAEARLPTHGFRFLSEFEMERFDFEEIPDDSDHGYILEVDITYPSALHDEHDGT